MSRLRLMQGYYLASPLFFVMGWWWGAEIRVTFLPDPGARLAYYAFLGGLGLLTHFKPKSTPFVAMGESALNLFLIMAWILLPIYGLADSPEWGPVGVPYTVQEVLVNGGLAGTVFLLAFYQAQGRILARFPFLGPGGGRDRR